MIMLQSPNAIKIFPKAIINFSVVFQTILAEISQHIYIISQTVSQQKS